MGRKISVILLAVCLVTAFSVHAADTVYSKNAVGFGKTMIQPGDFALCSPGFEGMASQNVQEVLKDQMTKGFTSSTGDNCLLWDSVSQTYITLYKIDTGGFIPEIDDKWVVAGGGGTPPLASNELAVGSAFWLINNQASAQEVCLKGDVPVAPTGTVEIVEGFNFISYPFAADIGLNDSDLAADGAAKGFTSSTADQVLEWDQDAQAYNVYFRLDTGGFVPVIDGKWVLSGGGGTPTLASNSLTLARGYFYNRLAGEGTLTWDEVKPYNL